MTAFSQLALRTATVAAALVVTAACDDQTATTTPTPSPAQAQAEVGVVVVRHQKLVIRNELPGRTSAHRVAEVRPQVGGIILKRLFEEGERVKAGQQLYQIDPSIYQAAYDSARADSVKAEAALKLARLKEGRYATLVRTSDVSRHAYDEAIAAVEQGQAQVTASKAALNTASINLHYTKVSSPISGRIGTSAFTEGALVTANQAAPLATVTQLDPIFVDVTQSSSELLKLRKAIAEGKLKGADAAQAPVILIMADGQEQYPEAGQLLFSEVVVDQTTGSIRLRAVFPNPREELLPGLFVRAIIQQAEATQAILVPQQAVLRNPDGSTAVWLVSPEGDIVPRTVVVSQAIEDKWLIDTGLEDGDTVVVSGFQKAGPGARVKAVPVGEPATSAGTPSVDARLR